MAQLAQSIGFDLANALAGVLRIDERASFAPGHIATEGTALGHGMNIADRNRWMPPRTAWYASSMSELTTTRQAFAYRGKRLEYFTIAWNTLEGFPNLPTRMRPSADSTIPSSCCSLLPRRIDDSFSYRLLVSLIQSVRLWFRSSCVLQFMLDTQSEFVLVNL
jgi:hypothetical protein